MAPSAVGSPYSHNVLVLVSFSPPFHSISNLCCSITKSRSPGSYIIFGSSVAHNVSSGVPLGSIFLSWEKTPSHRSPATMRSFSAVSLNEVLLEIAQTRSSSLLLLAPRIAFVASAHLGGSMFFGSSSFISSVDKKPIFTNVCTNSQKPPYRKVPLITVCASGILYDSLKGVESLFAYATKL